MKVYQDNVRKYAAEVMRLDNSLRTLSTLRLAVFLSSVIILVILANERLMASVLIMSPLCVLAFTVLVKRYNNVDNLKRHTTFLKLINEREILRLENKLSGFPTGQAYVNGEHPFVSDLDILGQHSLFQLLNRTTTDLGQSLLAAWLSSPADADVIYQRQEATRELSQRIEWRQEFQARGMNFQHRKDDYEHLLSLVKRPAKLLPQLKRYLSVTFVMSLLSTAALLYFLNSLFSLLSKNGIPNQESLLEAQFIALVPLVTALLVNTLILRTVRSIAREMTKKVSDHIKILAGYESLISSITSEKFQSEKLRGIQGTLAGADFSAEKEVKKLRGVLATFQLRGRKGEFNNIFYSFLNALWFLDVYMIMLTEKWINRNGSHLAVWTSCVSEFEGINSLAGFHYSNPAYVFPEVNYEPCNINFEMLGHPLISSEKRVCNDFSLHGCGEMAMVTGSNMAGKSTFLRTVGVNMVLALMGAPCCAKYGALSNVTIFTSMRTQDSLEDGISSFRAELKRIAQLLKLIESGQSVFFLLDEMFKGTNSKDRHRGGFSLIKQLKELNAFGIISTHDLDLAILAGKHKMVRNYSFNSSIREGEMIFDYALTEGLCSDFNASALMKRSGIKVLPYFESD